MKTEPTDVGKHPEIALAEISERCREASRKYFKEVSDYHGYDMAFWKVNMSIKLQEMDIEFNPLKEWELKTTDV